MSTELAVHSMGAQDFMPIMSLEQSVQRQQALVQYVKGQMVEGKDFGTIPGSAKPCLYKPGAEKLSTLFGLIVEDPEIITEVEDWTGAQHGGEPFFYYKIRQRLLRHGVPIASQFASCNSWESKYRYRWVSEADVPPGLNLDRLAKRGGAISELDFAIQKGETTGKYGKPAEYWQRFRDALDAGEARQVKRKKRDGTEMLAWEISAVVYRVPNEDVVSQVNTIQKMAQKRAFVAAVLIAVNASEFFTQDLEDVAEEQPHGESVQDTYVPSTKSAKPANGNGHKPVDDAADRQATEEWQVSLDGCRDRLSLNALLPSAREIAVKPLRVEIWRRFNVRAVGLGLVWDTEGKEFVVKAKPANSMAGPTTGEELKARVLAADKHYAELGISKPGELVADLTLEAMGLGWSEDVSKWPVGEYHEIKKAIENWRAGRQQAAPAA